MVSWEEFGLGILEVIVNMVDFWSRWLRRGFGYWDWWGVGTFVGCSDGVFNILDEWAFNWIGMRLGLGYLIMLVTSLKDLWSLLLGGRELGWFSRRGFGILWGVLVCGWRGLSHLSCWIRILKLPICFLLRWLIAYRVDADDANRTKTYLCLQWGLDFSGMVMFLMWPHALKIFAASFSSRFRRGRNSWSRFSMMEGRND